MTNRPARRRFLVEPANTGVAVIVAATLAMTLGTTGHAQPTTSPVGHMAASAPSSEVGFVDHDTQSITLVTGDRVHVGGFADGRHSLRVDPAPRPNGYTPSFRVSARGDQVYVVPSDMYGLVPDVLDPALFNVSYLVAHDYGERFDNAIPLIITYPDEKARTFAADPVPGVVESHELASVNAVAVSADASAAGEFGEAIFNLAHSSASGGDSSTRALEDSAAGPLADVEKIWLDAMVEGYLDHSVGQIGAPRGWDAGFDGTGVTVAVLDTGIDADHPDLAGLVADAQSFVFYEEPGDLNGHGTHVASIAAGAGAASLGAYRGVAPGATLLDGKVLDANGAGAISWVIAGMEWAAEEGADVINMSLGLPPGHHEAPLLTEALETISSTHDTVFVVAAGNGGCQACVGSPADAPSALTVGAVDGDDQLASFSSRGPTFATFGLKPDITAPGVDILAARAAGTGPPPAGSYVAYSGTSMAAPHVTGAMAILAQANPELSRQDLKGLLMSTAQPHGEQGIYDQGAGRVDVAQAIQPGVYALTGSVDFGFFPDGNERDTRHAIVNYINTTNEAVTIDLTVAADVHLAVEPTQMTLEAGDRGAARITLDLDSDDPPGHFLGELTATPSNDTTLRTPVSYVVEEEQFEVTLSAIARDGRPARLWANIIDSTIVDLKTGEQRYNLCADQPEDGTCFRVPASTYSIMGFVFTKPGWADSDGNPSTTTPLNTTLVGNPEITIDSDMSLTFDARDAVEIQVDTPAHESAPRLGGAVELAWLRTPDDGPTTMDYEMHVPGSQLEERFFMQPSDKVTMGSFTATSRWLLAEPEITLAVDGVPLEPRYYRPDSFSNNSWQFPMLDGESTLRLVDAGDGDDLSGADLEGSLALIRRSDYLPVVEQSNAAAEAGAEMVAIYNDVPGVNGEVGGYFTDTLTVPTVRLSHEEGMALLDQLATGELTVEARGVTASPYAYDLVYAERDRIPSELLYVADPDDLATVERNFHNSLTGMTFSEVSWPFQPGSPFATGFSRPLQGTPGSRTDYHVADPDTTWQYGLNTPELPYFRTSPEGTADYFFTSALASYPRPGHHRQNFLRHPLTSGFDATRAPVTRAQNILHIPLIGLVDADGNVTRAPTTYIAGDVSPDGIDSLFQIWFDDELVGETKRDAAGWARMPAEEGTVRLVHDVSNRAPWSVLSTRTRTEWQFRSAQTSDDGVVIPLMTIRYELALDLDNRMTHPRDRGGSNVLQIAVDHHGGVRIPVTDLTVDISYDDGANWQKLRARRQADGSYAANIGSSPAKGSGFVSFRVSAEDAHGNRIDQEVIRGVALPAN